MYRFPRTCVASAPCPFLLTRTMPAARMQVKKRLPLLMTVKCYAIYFVRLIALACEDSSEAEALTSR